MTFIPSGTFRGGIEVDDVLYAAFEDEIFTVASDGAIQYYADLAGADQVFWAANQNTTPDIVVVCDAGAFQSSGSTFVAYTDTDVGTPRGVTYHDGWFFFWYENGDIFASGLNATTINTLDTANAASNADGLVQCWPYNGQLYAAGEKTIEIWGYPVNNAGFPLNRVGYHVVPGLISEHAVAGYQPEWGNPPIYVGSDNTVRWLVGYQPQKISTPDLERLIASVDDKSQLKALAYRVSGTAFWELSSNETGNKWTWVFNVNNPGWFERKSDGQDRSRLTGGSVYSFGRWFVGDNTAPNLLEVTADVQTEGSPKIINPLIATIISPSMKDFPNRVRIPRADFDFAMPAMSADGWSQLSKIGNSIGTIIGDMPDGGGLSAGFDGVTSHIVDTSAIKLGGTSCYLGKSFVKAKAISKGIAYSPSDRGFTGNPTYTVSLYAKQGAAPTAYNDGTLLGSSTALDTDNLIQIVTIIPSDQVTKWDHVWFAQHYATSVEMRFAEVEFYEVIPSTDDPIVSITWSDDGGATYSNPYLRGLGASTADTLKRVTVLNTGISKPPGRRWKLEVSDPVDFALLGGNMDIEIRRK